MLSDMIFKSIFDFRIFIPTTYLHRYFDKDLYNLCLTLKIVFLDHTQSNIEQHGMKTHRNYTLTFFDIENDDVDSDIQ